MTFAPSIGFNTGSCPDMALSRMPGLRCQRSSRWFWTEIVPRAKSIGPLPCISRLEERSKLCRDRRRFGRHCHSDSRISQAFQYNWTRGCRQALRSLVGCTNTPPLTNRSEGDLAADYLVVKSRARLIAFRDIVRQIVRCEVCMAQSKASRLSDRSANLLSNIRMYFFVSARDILRDRRYRTSLRCVAG